MKSKSSWVPVPVGLRLFWGTFGKAYCIPYMQRADSLNIHTSKRCPYYLIPLHYELYLKTSSVEVSNKGLLWCASSYLHLSRQVFVFPIVFALRHQLAIYALWVISASGCVSKVATLTTLPPSANSAYWSGVKILDQTLSCGYQQMNPNVWLRKRILTYKSGLTIWCRSKVRCLRVLYPRSRLIVSRLSLQFN